MIVGIIQARLASTRLPQKVLADIAGKPLLWHVIDRAKASQELDAIVVATTNLIEDACIFEMAQLSGVKAFAGNSDDVLDRFYNAAQRTGADVIVRITADDPLKDPQVMDTIIKYLYANSDLDYVSNTIEPTFPEGLDLEVFTFKCLEKASREATLASDREHVTTYIWNHPEFFQIANVKHPNDYSHMRWTVDYEEDLLFVRAIYKALYHGKVFHMEEVLDLLEQKPELLKINSGINRNEGYARSIALEKEVLR